MKFKVSGADRDSGEDLEVIVDADDYRAAEEKASRWGLLVSSVKPAADDAGASNVTVVEQTAKEHKRTMAIGAAILLPSPFVLVLGIGIAGNSGEGSVGAGLGVMIALGSFVMFVAGFIVLLAGRAGQWWHHG